MYNFYYFLSRIISALSGLRILKIYVTFFWFSLTNKYFSWLTILEEDISIDLTKNYLQSSHSPTKNGREGEAEVAVALMRVLIFKMIFMVEISLIPQTVR